MSDWRQPGERGRISLVVDQASTADRQKKKKKKNTPIGVD
jgi:hypothetical protein